MGSTRGRRWDGAHELSYRSPFERCKGLGDGEVRTDLRSISKVEAVVSGKVLAVMSTGGEVCQDDSWVCGFSKRTDGSSIYSDKEDGRRRIKSSVLSTLSTSCL